MKKIVLTSLLAIGCLNAQAADGGARVHSIGGRAISSHSGVFRTGGGGGSHSGGGSWSGSHWSGGSGGSHWNGSHWDGGHHRSSSSFYFSFGGYPYYWPGYYYSYPYYSRPYVYSYPYYPAYGYSYSYPAYAYDYGYSRPNYAVGGTLLGALAGGLIGDSIHHQGWEGAGIGAAAGLLLGGLAEHSARVQERSMYSAPAISSLPANGYIGNAPSAGDPPAVSVAPRQVQNNAAPYRPVSAMSSANSLFGR